jgi:hypothetical protein
MLNDCSGQLQQASRNKPLEGSNILKADSGMLVLLLRWLEF